MATLHRALPSLLLLFTGCGGENFPDSDSLGRSLYPELLLANPDQEATARVRIETLSLPADPAEWELEGRSAQVSEDADGARHLVFDRGPDPAHLRIEGKFHSRELSQIRLRGVFPGPYEVSIQLSGGETEPLRPGAITTRAQRGEQALVFDLSVLRGTAVPYSTLDVLFKGPTRPFELHALELVHISLSGQLPDPGGPASMIEIGIEARNGVGLSRGRSLECRFPVEHEADRLSFAVGIPLHLRPRGGKPRVRVTLTVASGEGDDARQVTAPEVVQLEDRSSAPRWHDTTISLANYVGRDVVARFDYECNDEWPGISGLANVIVWRPAENPRSSLLVSSDTHRADHVGAAGALEIQTPGIDGLARDGLFFEQCWATTNVTSPSHVAMLTGLHPRDTRLITNQDRLSSSARTLAEAFHEAGWATIAVVSVRHLGPHGTDLGQGFDRILSPVAKPWNASVAVSAVENWLEDFEGRPVFVFLHVFDAHHPYEPPSSYDRLYYPGGRDPADPSLPELVARAGAIPKEMLESGLRDADYPRAQYKAEITYLDAQLTRLIEHERLSAGLIAVTADHGEILEKAGSFFNHGEIWPDTLHVPMVLGGALLPSEFRGRRASAPVTHLDLGRTLLDLAGLSPIEFPGRNLLASVDADSAESVPRFALAAHGLTASITSEGWYLLLHLRTHAGTHPGEKHQAELFDLRADPECLKDVGPEQSEQLTALREQLVEWLADTDGPGLSESRTASTAEIAELAALGYATETAVVEEEAWYDPDSK